MADGSKPSDLFRHRLRESLERGIAEMPEEQAAKMVATIRKKGYRWEADEFERIRREAGQT